MDPVLYMAAAEGKFDPFIQFGNDNLGSVVTHNKNTVLHVNIGSNREGESISTTFVEQVLEICPSLLLQVNAQGDAPLHVAARYGHAAVVGALIEFAKKQPGQELESGVENARASTSRTAPSGATTTHMLGMKNDEENTALHDAVQSGSLDVVKILLEADPAFPYSANCRGETPLYLAAARGRRHISAEILLNCPWAAHEGPSGKTALHAAVCSGSYGVIKILLESRRSLTGERDQHGWTPLHYDAYIGFFGFLILKADTSAALIPDEDRKMTALHLAAGQGNVLMVYQIIDHYPECCELVDDRGWNVLHFAMVSFDASGLKHLLNEYPVVRNLINDKDKMGNTPLHLLAALCRDSFYRIVPSNVGGDYQAVNKRNISVEHIIRYGFPELEKEIEKLSKADWSDKYPDGVVKINKNKVKKRVIYSIWKDLDEDVIGMKDASQSHLVVAALIATVTFAAAFTLPGGYKSDTEDGPNRGTAILSKKAAFQAFVISDAIAMVLSLSAVFVHFILSLKFFKKLIFLFVFALCFTLVAMAAMIVAFVTGTYAMLATPSLWLAIVTCMIGLTFFLLVIFMFYMVISKAEVIPKAKEVISKAKEEEE